MKWQPHKSSLFENQKNIKSPKLFKFLRIHVTHQRISFPREVRHRRSQKKRKKPSKETWSQDICCYLRAVRHFAFTLKMKTYFQKPTMQWAKQGLKKCYKLIAETAFPVFMYRISQQGQNRSDWGNIYLNKCCTWKRRCNTYRLLVCSCWYCSIVSFSFFLH